MPAIPGVPCPDPRHFRYSHRRVPAWAVAGLAAGLAAYLLLGEWPHEETSEDDVNPLVEVAPAHRAERSTGGRIVGVFLAAIAVIAFPYTEAGWAALAVAALGLAAGWALLGQERRLRTLERRLQELEAAREELPLEH